LFLYCCVHCFYIVVSIVFILLCALFLCCCVHCFYIVCIVSPFVYSCPFPNSVQVYLPLPPGGSPNAINKYCTMSYRKTVWQSLLKSELKSVLQLVTNPSTDFKRRIWPTDFERRFDSIACEAYGSFVLVTRPEGHPLHRPTDPMLLTPRTSISQCTVR